MSEKPGTLVSSTLAPQNKMTQHEQPAVVKEQVSTYLYFSSIYFVTIGILYLWGYWSTFDINILEYFSLADVLKATAYPIVSAFIFTAVGAVIGEFLVSPNKLPSGGGRDTRVGRFLRAIAPLLVLAYVLSTIGLFMFGPAEKWRILPMLLAFPPYLLSKERGFLATLIPHDSPRSVIIFLLAALPPFAYGHGRLQATAIAKGTDYKYVVSPVEGLDLSSDTKPDRQLRYLGHAGDFLFLLHPVKAVVVITKFEQAKTLQLKQFKASQQSAATGSNTAHPSR